MSGESTFPKTHLPQSTTFEFNDFAFSRELTPETLLKSNTKKRYPCKLCDVQFFCKKSLLQHRLLTHKKSEKVLQHKSTNDLNDSFFCQERNLDIGHESTFLEHSLIHNSKQAFVCEICNESFPVMNDLQKHCQLEHAQKTLSSVEESKLDDKYMKVEPLESILISKEPFLCDEKSARDIDVREHSLTLDNPKKFVCNVCDKKFILKRSYIAHCKTHTIKASKDKNLICIVWQQKLSAQNIKNNLKKNIIACVRGGKDSNDHEEKEDIKAQHKDIDERGDLNETYIAPEDNHLNDLGKEFKDKARCINFKIISGGKEIKVMTVKKDLTNKSDCKEKPKRNVSGCEEKSKWKKVKSVRNNYTCDVCGKNYKLKIAFMSHQMSHIAKKLKCEVCHKEFTSNKLLKLHFRTHSDMRFFFCEVCNKGFKHKHHLRTHFITHTDELPFVCEVCNKGYKHKWGLKQHAQLHSKKHKKGNKFGPEAENRGGEVETSSGDIATKTKIKTRNRNTKEKLFFCDLCNKGFHHRYHLRRHLTTHAEKFRFACEVCSAGFKHEWDLKQHALMHANKLPLPCEICGKSFEKVQDLAVHFSTHVKESPETENWGREFDALAASDEPHRDIAIETCKMECIEEEVDFSKESSQILVSAIDACKLEFSSET